jgi:pyrimidine-nucleoside phosphorylase
MNVPLLIKKKRDGQALESSEIHDFVELYTRGEIPDYQASALLMAIYFNGLNRAETSSLTEAMMHSGTVVDLSEFTQAKVDKHSTGGVGDKTSLVVAPAAVAGGLMVPMISGRGLGHTGGTLDKLESIPGFRTSLSLEEFRRTLAACGMALIGQTEELAPADRKLYSLRDVTATVESIPLISASIMSKKLAEGIDGLVLDVKSGSGAFMKTAERSRELAARMVEIGQAAGKRVCALITAMDQPLGQAVGNALEVKECLEVLKGRGPADLADLCRELTAEMFVLGGVESSPAAARARFDAVIASGKALEAFARVIERQGGDPRVVEDDGHLPAARHRESFPAWQAGYLNSMDAELTGRASMALGAGRERLDSLIDPAVGLVFEKKVGDAVKPGDCICRLEFNDAGSLPVARRLLKQAIQIAPQPPGAQPVLLGREPA